LAGLVAITITFIINQFYENKFISYLHYSCIALFAAILSYLAFNYLHNLLALAAQVAIIFSSYSFATAGGPFSFPEKLAAGNYSILFSSSNSAPSSGSNSDNLEANLNSSSLGNSSNEHSSQQVNSNDISIFTKILDLPNELICEIKRIYLYNLYLPTFERNVISYKQIHSSTRHYPEDVGLCLPQTDGTVNYNGHKRER